MKVNETQRISGINSYRKSNETKPQTNDKKTKARDEVNISNEAKLLHSAGDRQKIEDLKQQVSSGTYKVDAGKVADRLLPFLMENQ